MKKILVIVVAFQAAIIAFLIFWKSENPARSLVFAPSPTPAPKPLLKYTYDNLKNYTPQSSDVKIEQTLKEDEKDDFVSYLFNFYIKDGRKVSGLMNVPKKTGKYPMMLLIRGYVDPSVYETGIGSQHVGEFFAQNGFITLAPDYLGYGSSDKPSKDGFEDRFLTYITTMDLLESFPNVSKALEDYDVKGVSADSDKIGIWAHSNGGQIALTVAELRGFDYPMVLWAPVSKPFPYSILFYTDEYNDDGKAMRKAVADFESIYDAQKYSLTEHLDWINSPIQIHQGISDIEVPENWSSEFVEKLEKADKKVEYFTYPGENHNFQNGSWPTAVLRSMEFVRKNLKIEKPELTITMTPNL
ncbi:MAG: prolyl oligopeptidase family serine peptidase [Patescibacteria group bacterium]